MASTDLFSSTPAAGKGARVKKPSQALQDRVAQSAAQQAEYDKKIGKRQKAKAKENIPLTGEARVAESRKQITSTPVALPAARVLAKPRAAITPRAALQLKTLQALRPKSTPKPVQQRLPAGKLPADNLLDGDDDDIDGDIDGDGDGEALEAAASPTRPRAPRQARGQGRLPRPRAGDLPSIERRFVEQAYPPMRALVSIDPFNTKEENEKKVATAIGRARALNDKYKDLVVSDEMHTLILARAAQLQGDVKRISDNKTAAHFKLVSSCKTKIVDKNKDKVDELLNGDAFMYKNTEERLGLYRHPCIADIVNTVWFSARNKEGPLYPNIFNADGDGIPAQVLALVLTAMYSSLLQWETGTFAPVKFTETRFHGEYLDILADIKTHAKGSPKLYRKICLDLYKGGIAHAGVVIQARQRSGLTAADFERAALMDGLDSDDDSDEEELAVPVHAPDQRSDEPCPMQPEQEPEEPAVQPVRQARMSAWFTQALAERNAADSKDIAAAGTGHSKKRNREAHESADDEAQYAEPLRKRQRATELPPDEDDNVEASEPAQDGGYDAAKDRKFLEYLPESERAKFLEMSREERDEVLQHMLDIMNAEQAAAAAASSAEDGSVEGEDEDEDEDEDIST